MRILVIKLSALGDFILALGPMAAIRQHHKGAHITLLTTAPFEDLARRSGYFDDIEIDTRPGLFNIFAQQSLKQKLRNGQYDRVYNLQNNARTEKYFKFFPKDARPEWVGLAAGASHSYTNPNWRDMHALDRHIDMLKLAGIETVPLPDLTWMDSGCAHLSLPKDFILLATGAAPSRPKKRWPVEHFSLLAEQLVHDGQTPVLLGTVHETKINRAITQHCPEALDLTGKTSLFDIAALAYKARAAVGNDTGPMHIIAMTGCPSVVLFSAESNPDQCAPRGKEVRVLQRDRLENLPPALVYKTITLRSR